MHVESKETLNKGTVIHRDRILFPRQGPHLFVCQDEDDIISITTKELGQTTRQDINSSDQNEDEEQDFNSDSVINEAEAGSVSAFLPPHHTSSDSYGLLCRSTTTFQHF